MLKRTDNPELFRAICSAYRHQFPQDKSVDALTTRELPDEILAKITSLVIEADTFFGNIKSLNGIEQLVNLTEFSLNGQSRWKHHKEFRGTLERSQVVTGYNLEEDLRFFLDEYNSGQIEDISPIYQLKHLKKLELRHQRKIREVDFSNNPNLVEVDMSYCEELRTIKGLDTLNVVNGRKIDGLDFIDSRFEFSGCHNLREVDSLDLLVAHLDNNPNIDLDAHIFLPTTTFCHIARNNQPICELLAQRHIDCLDYIHWTEIGKGDVRVENSSSQMLIAKRYVDETIKTLFHGQSPTDLELASGVYRWICDNIKYDYDGLKQSETEDPKKRYRKKDSIRSSYVALINKKAVCVGVSNLFNLFMASLGFTAEPCPCSSEMAHDARMTDSNHMMSRIYVNNIPYYCDPTWDLGGEESRYFCLSKEEIERTHKFDVSAYSTKSGPSYQKIFKQQGLLQTKKQQQMV